MSKMNDILSVFALPHLCITAENIGFIKTVKLSHAAAIVLAIIQAILISFILIFLTLLLI